MRLLGLTTICALAFVMPTVAHHSHGNYTDGTIDIEGVVKEVVLVVPHSYVYIDVKKGDATETWVPKRRAVAAWKRSVSRATISRWAMRSRRAATSCVMAPTAVCLGS